MSKGFGIHGSATSHGGTVLSTQSRSSQMGNLFLRAGDGFSCPKCKTWSTLIKSNDHVVFNGKAVAYVGDKFTCGANLMPRQVHVIGTSGRTLGASLTGQFARFSRLGAACGPYAAACTLAIMIVGAIIGGILGDHASDTFEEESAEFIRWKLI
ncbi:PAAR domain-containing protein [Acinetobacter sp. RF14B]|uniref:PAAR domain-containing protein n=1 Tax=Acinetobacter sp. RF14B TaxID=2650965 RepID=UPI00116CC506|nr:PAAR domain-containing protein [Acinetobacter sp. RF14B]TQR64452.1 PAAR domain-containing protein [Acinetobacter sp. RF14B]